ASAEELFPHLPVDGQLGDVPDVPVELHDVREGRTGALQGDLEIAEGLLSLGTDVVLANDVALGIERDLPGDVDRPPGWDVDHVRVAARRRETGRIGKGRVGHGGSSGVSTAEDGGDDEGEESKGAHAATLARERQQWQHSRAARKGGQTPDRSPSVRAARA